MNSAAAFSALFVVAVVYALDRFGLLPKKRGAADLAGEADLATKALARANVELAELRRTRTLEPILDQLHTNAELQAQVLDRLVHHNGSFKEMHKQMQLLTDGVQTVVGFIAELHGLEVRQPARLGGPDGPTR